MDERQSEAFYAKINEIGEFIRTDWSVTQEGVYMEKLSKKNGETMSAREWASPIPVIPVALLRNVDSGIEKVELSFFKSGRWGAVITPRSVAANKNSIIRLADNGLEVNSDNAGLLVRYIANTVASSLDSMPRRRAKSVLGWCGEAFLPYADDIVFDGDDTFRHLYKAIGTRGNLAEWIDYVAPLRKNLQLRLVMAASFASPLIELIGENPFVLHIYGGTGAGKTVALMVAMSVWGDPAMGKLTRTMNMTQNSMLSTAAFLRNLPFCGDELQTIKSSWANYDQLIMRITEGVDRGRMTYDKLNETKSWKCSFLFSGEEPCTKQSSGGGAKNRVIEIECTGKLVENGNETANFVRRNYGCAGQPYIEFVRTQPVAEMYASLFRQILSEADTTDKQAGSMALLLVADRLASQLFFTREEPIRIEDVQRYLRSAHEVDVAERSFAYVVNLVAKNIANFQDAAHESWGRLDAAHGTVLVNKLVLEEQMEAKGFDFDAVKRKWKERGYLVPNSQGKLVHQTKCGGVRATYIKLALPEERADSDEDVLPW